MSLSSAVGSPVNGPRPPTVLVVEDEYMVRLAIARYLEDAGWRVLEAGTAEQAIAIGMSETPVDVLFTDIQLDSHGCGWDVADAFRGARPDIAVVYASGNSSDHFRRVPGSLFFDKPYSASDVVEACRRVSTRLPAAPAWRRSANMGG
jgi:CheY-like chemotaxis protein